MGYDDNDTAAAVSAKTDPLQAWIARVNLIGSGFSIQAVAWLLGHLVSAQGCPTLARSREVACRRGKALAFWLETEAFD